jgi:phosphatidate cytidylyltransferase
MELRRRVATALLLAPPAVALILFAPNFALALVFAALLAVAALEWAPLAGWGGAVRPWLYAGAVGALCGLCWGFAFDRPDLARTTLGAGLLWWAFATAWILRRWALGRAAKLLAGLLVLVPAWFAVVALHRLAHGPELVLLLLLIIWGADVGAYFVGHRFGRNKLAPEVSPGKTWEGVAGGFALGLLVAGTGAVVVGLDLALTLAMGAVTVATSIVGDLAESLAKRQAGVKDSGTLLPGHGGVLDRLDSLFAAAPVFLSGWLLLGGGA